jgi:hypothetical protein
MGREAGENVAIAGCERQCLDVEFTCVARGETGSIGHADGDRVAGRAGVDVGTRGLEVMARSAGIGDGEGVVGWGSAKKRRMV